MTGAAATSALFDPTAVSGGASSGDKIAIARLMLTDFRNYAHAVIEPLGRSVVLTGENGAGKTNILEAISFLSPGRGLRRSKLSEITRSEPEATQPPTGRYWAVAARLDGPDGETDLGTGVDPDNSGPRERRIVRIDGNTERAQSVLAEHASVIWLTPQMDGLFIDGPGARRRFLDRLVYATDPAHAGRVSAYEQAMRDRLRLLTDRGDAADAVWLTALEATMAEKGMAVAAARRDMVGRLAAFIVAGTGPFPGAELALCGGPEAWLDDGPALAAEDRFRDALAAERGIDAADGRTHTGPHLTDFAVRHATKGRQAAHCSTGEQKALLIGLVLAHARMQAAAEGRRPIQLLDEVVAHLDGARREALFGMIADLRTQAWMTGTDAALFAGVKDDAHFFTVADGSIHDPHA